MSVVNFSRLGLFARASVVAMVAGLGLGSAALAQGAAPAAKSSTTAQAPEELVVTGYRGSLVKALDLKRNSTQAVDAIEAEDLAKFPDLSLGDAIQRVPGVALQRDGGEGRNISVRGLGPNFTRITIDGMEAQATNTSPDNLGGVTRSRNFDFNTFAPDLFNQIVVAKTQTPETEEGSLGATVNLSLAHALDHPGLHFAANGKEGYNDLSKDYSPRGSFIASDTFMDDKIGVLISGAYTKRKFQEVGTSDVREGSKFETTPGFHSVSGLSILDASGTSLATCDNVTPATTLTCADAALQARFSGRLDQWENDQTRKSGAISLEFRPMESTKFSVDAMIADFSVNRSESNLEAPVFQVASACLTGTGTASSPNNVGSSCGVAQTDMLSGTIVNTGVPAFYAAAPPTVSFAPNGPSSASLVAGKNIYALVKGTFNNVDIRSEQRYDEYDTKFKQVTFNFEHNFSDKLKLTGLAGYAKSAFKQPVYALLIWDQFNVQGASFDYGSPSGTVPAVNWGNANLTNPATWVLTQIRLRPSSTDNAFLNYQTNLDWKAFDGLSFKGGFDFKRYEFAAISLRRVGPVTNGNVYPITIPPTAGNPYTSTTPFFSGAACNTGALATNVETCVPATVASINPSTGGFPAGIPNSAYAHVVNFNTSGITTPTGNATSWIGPDVKTAINVLGLLNPSLFPLSNIPDIGNNRSVVEKDSGGYLEANFDTSVSGIGVRGSLGERIVRTQQRATNLGLVAGAIVPQSSSRNYTNILPSLNVVIEPFSDFLIRLGAAKVMVRPNLGDLTGTSLNVAGGTRTVTVGNSGLNPFTAKAYDVAFEYYFQPGALISVALFRKEVEESITRLSLSTVFHGNPFGLDDAQATAACGGTVGCSATSGNWTFSESVNAPGGTINGVEVNYQQPFTFLPWLFRNTGVLLNYTYVKSNLPQPFLGAVPAGNTLPISNFLIFPIRTPLLNQSKRTENATLYYDDGKFEGRVSVSMRTAYLTAIPSAAQQGDDDLVGQTVNVDASASYAINDNLAITLEGVNLTDEFVDQFNSSAELLFTHHHTGREFFLGARYKY